MKYKNLRKLNDYVQANGWELMNIYGELLIIRRYEKVASVKDYLGLDTTYPFFYDLTDQKKRTLFDLLVEVAKLTDEERLEMYTDEEYEEMLNQSDRKHDNEVENLESCD